MEQVFWCAFTITAVGMICYAIYLLRKKRDKFYDFLGNLLIAMAGFVLAGALLWKEFRKTEIDERNHECNALFVMQKELQRKIANLDQLALLTQFIDSSSTIKKLDRPQRDEAIIFHLSNELSFFSKDFRYEVFYDQSIAHLFRPGFFYIIDSLVYQIQYIEDQIVKNREYTEKYRTIASDVNEYNRGHFEIGSFNDPRIYQAILRSQVLAFYEVFKQKYREIKTYYEQLHKAIDNRYAEIYREYPEILEQMQKN